MIRDQPALAELFENAQPATVLAAVERDDRFADFRRAFESYLERWGFRCSSELMLTVPSFQEAPEPLIGMLAHYARLEGESPVDALRRQASEREVETLRVMAALRGRGFFAGWPLPTYAGVVRVLLGWTHAAIRFRERARLKQALLYSRCRRIALALGAELTRRGLLATPDDVFWLTAHELDELASGGAMLAADTRELVALRARAHAEQSALIPPDSFELDEGPYWDGSTTVLAAPAGRVGTFTGISACGGRVTGRASVLRDVTEAARLAQGDVLVTRQTDPGWGPVFFLIAGLVIERGGMLSHGAIVARDFGIPAVVLPGATKIIPEGATVRIDGNKGRVELQK
jgi:pyruvate,water dikinase